jgi:hypothetical protein
MRRRSGGGGGLGIPRFLNNSTTEQYFEMLLSHEDFAGVAHTSEQYFGGVVDTGDKF